MQQLTALSVNRHFAFIESPGVNHRMVFYVSIANTEQWLSKTLFEMNVDILEAVNPSLLLTLIVNKRFWRNRRLLQQLTVLLVKPFKTIIKIVTESSSTLKKSVPVLYSCLIVKFPQSRQEIQRMNDIVVNGWWPL